MRASVKASVVLMERARAFLVPDRTGRTTDIDTRRIKELERRPGAGVRVIRSPSAGTMNLRRLSANACAALLLLVLVGGCAIRSPAQPPSNAPFIVILGIAQDGGHPQAGCTQPHCTAAWADPGLRRLVSSIAIVDPESGERWLIDATPDFREQLHELGKIAPERDGPALDGIFLTHAHIGHYAGLIHLGREVMGARQVPVYAMPRMAEFLRTNGPWEQLVTLGNISIRAIAHASAVKLNGRISVTPILVPHRDEYSETVGFIVRGPSRSVLYLPDIDKWERWETPIESVIEEMDVALLDGTFHSEGELPGRSMAEIPHPFIIESLTRFSRLPASQRSKIHFIHLNHSNPALPPGSEARGEIERSGSRVAEEGSRIDL